MYCWFNGMINKKPIIKNNGVIKKNEQQTNEYAWIYLHSSLILLNTLLSNKIAVCPIPHNPK